MKKLEKILPIIFFLSIVFSLLQPVYDPDAFWHLKTGQWILENGQIPEKDPFAYTTGTDTLRSRSILRSYWLAEILLAGLYSLSGLYGVVVFRVLIYLSILIFLFLYARKRGLDSLTSTTLLLPIGLVAIYYMGERPNNLTYLYSVIIMGVLFRFQKEKKEGRLPSVFVVALLPALMVLWANSHGGYIFGIVMLGAFGFGVVVDRMRGGSDIRYTWICLLSILVTVLNPNGWNSVLSFSKTLSTDYFSSVGELQSPLALFLGGSPVPMIIYLLAAVAGLLSIRRYGVYEGALFLFLGIIGLRAVRFIPFFVFFAFFSLLIYQGAALRGLMARRGVKVYALWILPVIFFVSIVYHYPLSLFKNGVVPERYPFGYPERAAEFIKKNRISGRMFNYFEYGGYFIYALYPDYQVFIDTRAIDLSVYDEYNKVMKGVEGDIPSVRSPLWERILDKYRVNFILLPSIHTVTGAFNPIVYRLVNSSQWSLVYSDSLILLFVREIPENREITSRFSLPKNIAYANAYDQLRSFYSEGGPTWRQFLTMGRVALYDYRRNDAIAFFRKAIELNPSLREKDAGRVKELLEAGKGLKDLAEKILYLNIEDFHIR